MNPSLFRVFASRPSHEVACHAGQLSAVGYARWLNAAYQSLNWEWKVKRLVVRHDEATVGCTRGRFCQELAGYESS